MKEIFRLKAEKLAQSYREKHSSRHGELYTDFNIRDYTDHLINISHLKSLVYRNPLDKEAQPIVDAFFKKDNGEEFNSIVTEHLLRLAKSAEEAFSRRETLTIYQGIRPVVQEIAYRMIVDEGVRSILNHPDLNYGTDG